MEHRHIPTRKDGVIPDAKTRFLLGQENFLEGAWYGRCAICGELIRPPKLWYWYERGLFMLPLAILSPAFHFIYKLADETSGPAYLAYTLCLFTFLSVVAITFLMEYAILAFGRWQDFPKGLEGKQLQFRDDRKSRKSRLVWSVIILLIEAINLALYFLLRR